MRKTFFKKQFKKDFKRYQKIGRNMARFNEAWEALKEGEPLPQHFRDHALVGNWKDHRECHLGGDWLLIYQMTESKLILVRMGSHSELFD